jgi:hypothetical protein
LVQDLSALSSRLYTVAYVDPKALSPASAGQHALFCEAPMCLVVFDRRNGGADEEWGGALAIFELPGQGDEPVGRIWLADGALRSPGAKRWNLLCRTEKDTPMHVHPEGGAIYPLHAGSDGHAFALFGSDELAAEYRSNGFAAPSEELCDEGLVRLQAGPGRPALNFDPAMLQGH